MVEALDLRKRQFGECLAPRAFAGRDGEVVALYGHEKRNQLPLGSSLSGTPRLHDDGVGQAFELDSPDTSFAPDLLVSIERGDFSETSFSFIVPNGAEPDQLDRGQGGLFRRAVHRAVKIDVSILARGAYAGADLAVRDAGERLETFLAVDEGVRGHPNQRLSISSGGWIWDKLAYQGNEGRLLKAHTRKPGNL